MMQHIILIGFMGTGKSTVGQEVAKKLGCSFTDLDAAVVALEGRTIPDIFASDGEAYFREQESHVLAGILNSPTRHVIATGGGIVLQESNRELMRDGGFIVHLAASKETILSRVKRDRNRPLLQGDVEAQVSKLMQQREGLYDFAHTTVLTDHETAVQLAARICKLVEGKCE
ncbi:shikimate kinase [Paenibacillaceae sp. P-4]|uniref:shikimate kinase n=1 Tax=Paenibacillaceae bacterium P-4 TaxID=3160969 RepID=UPI0032E803A5